MFVRIFLLILLILNASVFAQRLLTLDEAWQMVLRNNLTLQQQLKVIEQSAEEVRIQQTGFLPRLGITGGYQHFSETAEIELPFSLPNTPSTIQAGVNNRYDFAATVQQPIFTGFRTRNLVKAAQQQQFAQQIQREVVQNQLRLQVGLAFYQLQFNQNQQAVLRESIQRAANQLQLTRSLFRAAQVAAFDTLEVANRKLQLETQLQQLRNLYQVQLSQFRFLLNIDEPVDVKPIKLESVDLTQVDLTAAQSGAIKMRPELQQIAALQNAQEKRSGALKSQYFPQIFAEAAYHYSRPGVNFFRDEWMDYYTLSVGLQWEIWNWGKSRRQVAQSRLESQKLSLKEQQLVNDIRRQVTEAAELLETTREQIRLQRQLATQEKERYRIAKNAFAQGQATGLDLQNAETALTQAELLLRQRYIEGRQLMLQLAFATGEIGER